MRESLLKKRDFTMNILRDAGFVPVVPEGGYFVMADSSKLGNSENCINKTRICTGILKTKLHEYSF